MFSGPRGCPFPPPRPPPLPSLSSPALLSPPPSPSPSRWATHLVVGSATSSKVGKLRLSLQRTSQASLASALCRGLVPLLLGVWVVPQVLRFLSGTQKKKGF